MWPTANSFDSERPDETLEEWQARRARKRAENANLGDLQYTLSHAASHFPLGPPAPPTTPRGSGSSSAGPTSPPPLWPTANVPNGGRQRHTTDQMIDGKKRQLSLETATTLWPTPDANAMNDGEDPATWEARRERLRAKGYNGNGAGTPLAVATAQWQTQGPARRLNPRFVEWLQGLPLDWTAEVPRVDRLRCLGNAVVPAQAAYAIALLVQELEAYEQSQRQSG